MPIYSTRNLQELHQNFETLTERYQNTLLALSLRSSELVQPRAREYLIQGVARRHSTIFRCVARIYKVFPPERMSLLSIDELTDVAINLQSMFINVFGLLDNLAWVIYHEKQLTIDRRNVGLYHRNFQEHLSAEFARYLNSGENQRWHNEYLKEYRDALAHRIPLYIPPYESTEENPEERYPCREYVHSLNETDERVKMHPQVLADFSTVEAIVDQFCRLELRPPVANQEAADGGRD